MIRKLKGGHQSGSRYLAGQKLFLRSSLFVQTVEIPLGCSVGQLLWIGDKHLRVAKLRFKAIAVKHGVGVKVDNR